MAHRYCSYEVLCAAFNMYLGKTWCARVRLSCDRVDNAVPGILSRELITYIERQLRNGLSVVSPYGYFVQSAVEANDIIVGILLTGQFKVVSCQGKSLGDRVRITPQFQGDSPVVVKFCGISTKLACQFETGYRRDESSLATKAICSVFGSSWVSPQFRQLSEDWQCLGQIARLLEGNSLLELPNMSFRSHGNECDRAEDDEG
jgi:hypothetical protein